MNIIERPLEAGNKTNKPKLIVIHAMAEYIIDPEPIFAPDFLEKYGLSAHALIIPNGDVMICRPDNAGAYHARGFNTDSLGVEFLVSGSHNYGTFIEAIKHDWVTPDQVEAGIELVSGWRKKYDIKKSVSINDTDYPGICRHSDISPGRKVDPGAGFKWSSFLRKVWE